MHKKIIILSISLIISTILLVVLCNILFEITNNKKSCSDSYLEFAEKNNEEIFTIDQITYFSNCNADISTNANSSFTIKNLCQYTDIAIFINNNSSDSTFTPENTLKTVTLSNIEYILEPQYGTPSLYYKNLNDFSKSTYEDENKIQDSITFETTSEDEIDYSKPILYNNCANPITLCYVNSGIEDKYTLSDDVAKISHNGSLLKRCGITLNSISCQISFTVNITNNLDEVFTCPVIINIPLSTEESTIYDGNLIFEDTTNYKFIKQ